MDSLQAYLREIGKTKLLTVAEEVEIASRVAKGDSRAREHLIVANLRLVVSIARNYRNQGLSLQDLISEGNMGLIRAAEMYSIGYNTRFSTYATYWVTQAIKRAIMNQVRTVRIPCYLSELLKKWYQTAKSMTTESYSPTPEDIAKKMKLPKKKLSLIKKAIGLSNQIDSNYIDIHIQNDSTESQLDIDIDNAKINKIIGKMLTPREQSVLKKRFGIGCTPQTLKEIGFELHVTRERIRQIEIQAKAKVEKWLKMDLDLD
jgi:RNA polymerase primary sigma factor